MRKIISLFILAAILASCNTGSKRKKNTEHIKIVQATKNVATMPSYVYEGTIMAEDSTSLLYNLTISKNDYNSEGKYILIVKHQTSDSAYNMRTDKSFTSRGQLYTQRGSANDRNATVYKLIDEVDESTFYFMLAGNNELRVLNDKLEDISNETNQNYSIVLVR